jgi:hypothetical protein
MEIMWKWTGERTIISHHCQKFNMKQDVVAYYNSKFVAQLFVNTFSSQQNDKCSNGAGVRIKSEQCNSDGMD